MCKTITLLKQYLSCVNKPLHDTEICRHTDYRGNQSLLYLLFIVFTVLFTQPCSYPLRLDMMTEVSEVSVRKSRT